VSQNKVYPLNDALQVRDDLMDIELKENNLDKARQQIKAIAPWVSDKDVVYNNNEEPIGVSGSHTPFPPFHWKCRTETEMVM
jgi:hypothetical protein